MISVQQLKNNVVDRVCDILWHESIIYGEILSGFLATGWGLTILFPVNGDTTTVVFDTMLSMFPRLVWGVIIFVLGMLQLIGAIVGKHRIRSAAALLIFPMWFLLAVVITLVGLSYPGFVFYGFFVLMCVWVNYRLIIGRYGD
jgi:hypothetical protein